MHPQPGVHPRQRLTCRAKPEAHRAQTQQCVLQQHPRHSLGWRVLQWSRCSWHTPWHLCGRCSLRSMSQRHQAPAAVVSWQHLWHDEVSSRLRQQAHTSNDLTNTKKKALPQPWRLCVRAHVCMYVYMYACARPCISSCNCMFKAGLPSTSTWHTCAPLLHSNTHTQACAHMQVVNRALRHHGAVQATQAAHAQQARSTRSCQVLDAGLVGCRDAE